MLNDNDCTGGGTCVWTRDPGEYETVLSGDIDGDDDPGEFPNDVNMADNTYHVLLVGGASPQFDSLTITAGNADHSTDNQHKSGGGLICTNGAPVFDNCTFKYNFATDNGGAVESEGVAPGISRIKFENCLFDTNAADNFGGAVYKSESTGKFTGCLFQDNQSARGGAIFVHTERSTF